MKFYKSNETYMTLSKNLTDTVFISVVYRKPFKDNNCNMVSVVILQKWLNDKSVFHLFLTKVIYQCHCMLCGYIYADNE